MELDRVSHLLIYGGQKLDECTGMCIGDTRELTLGNRDVDALLFEQQVNRPSDGSGRIQDQFLCCALSSFLPDLVYQHRLSVYRHGSAKHSTYFHPLELLFSRGSGFY